MTRQARSARVTVWFTGLPSAGKTTIAGLIARRLVEQGRRVQVLDGELTQARAGLRTGERNMIPVIEHMF